MVLIKIVVSLHRTIKQYEKMENTIQIKETDYIELKRMQKVVDKLRDWAWESKDFPTSIKLTKISIAIQNQIFACGAIENYLRSEVKPINQ